MVEFTNPYWSDKLKVEYLQRRIIIYSLIYYELNASIISDARYDETVEQMRGIIKEMPREDLLKTNYYYCVGEMSETTSGFDVCKKLNTEDYSYLLMIATSVLQQYNLQNVGQLSSREWCNEDR